MGRQRNTLRVQFSLRTLLGAVLLASILLTLATLADFRLTFGNTLHIRGENGRLTFCDALENGANIDGWGDLSSYYPPASADIGKSVWGFGFRYVTFAGSSTVWYLHLPLLVPLVIFTVLFGLCVNHVRKMRRNAA